MRAARMHFIRHFYIMDDEIIQLIDGLFPDPGTSMDHDSDQFALAYRRVQEWRKNWSCEFNAAIDDLRAKFIATTPGLLHTPTKDLHIEYAKYFSYETMWSLLGTFREILDLRACLADDRISPLYETVFAWGLTFNHMWKHGVGSDGIERTVFIRNTRLIAYQKSFANIKKGDLYLHPEKPVAKVRKATKQRLTGTEQLGGGFAVIIKGTPRVPSPPRSARRSGLRDEASDEELEEESSQTLREEQ